MTIVLHYQGSNHIYFSPQLSSSSTMSMVPST